MNAEFLQMQKLAGIITEGEYREKLKEEEASSKKKLIILVGPPSVGKSTWIKSNFP